MKVVSVKDFSQFSGVCRKLSVFCNIQTNTLNTDQNRQNNYDKVFAELPLYAKTLDFKMRGGAFVTVDTVLPKEDKRYITGVLVWETVYTNTTAKFWIQAVITIPGSKGCGKLLVKEAVNRSSNGRVFLKALNGSTGFYGSLGFERLDKSENPEMRLDASTSSYWVTRGDECVIKEPAENVSEKDSMEAINSAHLVHPTQLSNSPFTKTLGSISAR